MADVTSRSQSQIILFSAHVNKVNGLREICKLLSNWPVRTVKPCQTREGNSENRTGRPYIINELVRGCIHSTFHVFLRTSQSWVGAQTH